MCCRVRKRFQVLNVGTGVMELAVETTAPWSVVQATDAGEGAGGAGGAGDADCGCNSRLAMRLQSVPLRLEPRSNTEVTLSFTRVFKSLI